MPGFMWTVPKRKWKRLLRPLSSLSGGGLQKTGGFLEDGGLEVSRWVTTAKVAGKGQCYHYLDHRSLNRNWLLSSKRENLPFTIPHDIAVCHFSAIFFPLHLFQVGGDDNPAWSFLDYATNVTACKFFVLLQTMNVSRGIYLNPVSDQ